MISRLQAPSMGYRRAVRERSGPPRSRRADRRSSGILAGSGSAPHSLAGRGLAAAHDAYRSLLGRMPHLGRAFSDLPGYPAISKREIPYRLAALTN